MADVFVNKVAESGIITLNPEDFFSKDDIVVFDLKDHLFMGLILKEKEFRQSLKELDLTVYKGKNVAITCSADAVIPMWANMLVISAVQDVAKAVYYGTADEVSKQILLENIRNTDVMPYDEKRIVLKGCGEKPVPEAAYVELTKLLRPVAKSIMYGEPCSTVPVYKKPKATA